MPRSREFRQLRFRHRRHFYSRHAHARYPSLEDIVELRRNVRVELLQPVVDLLRLLLVAARVKGFAKIEKPRDAVAIKFDHLLERADRVREITKSAIAKTELIEGDSPAGMKRIRRVERGDRILILAESVVRGTKI